MLGQRAGGKAQGCEAGRGLEEKELESFFRLGLSILWSLGWFGNLHLGLESVHPLAMSCKGSICLFSSSTLKVT